MTRLSKALTEANVDRLSTRAIASVAEGQGHSIHYSTVSLYLNGKHGEPDEPTLAALAAVLPVTLAELREAAGLPFESDEPYVPPAESARMTQRQRRAVDELIRLLAKTGEPHVRTATTTQAAGSAATDDDDRSDAPQPPAPGSGEAEVPLRSALGSSRSGGRPTTGTRRGSGRGANRRREGE